MRAFNPFDFTNTPYLNVKKACAFLLYYEETSVPNRAHPGYTAVHVPGPSDSFRRRCKADHVTQEKVNDGK